jgi:molybdenum cofactor cytidylyltransferase
MAETQDMEYPGMDKRPTAGIVLAAGMSARFGPLKPLFKVGNGTILSMVIDAAVKSDLDRIVLVLGYQSDEIIADIVHQFHDPRLRTVINPRYRDGMSSSIQRGLLEIMDEFQSVMIIMGDHPLLDSDTINILLDRFRTSDRDICVPACRGTRGLPVCFGKRFFPDIMDITGDIGAREIIQKNPEHVLTVELENPDCFLDVDNKSDVAALLSSFQKTKI